MAAKWPDSFYELSKYITLAYNNISLTILWKVKSSII